MFFGRRRLRALTLIAATVLFAGGCTQEDEPGSRAVEIGSVSVLEGDVSLRHQGSESSLSAETPLTAGDVVMVEGSGVALVELDGGRKLEVTGGSLETKSGESVVSSGGSLLVDTDSTVEVLTGIATARIDSGAVRFDGPAVGRIGAYDAAGIVLTSGDQKYDLPRYWQVLVGSSGAFEQARPLQIDGADALDRRFLQRALDTDASLANLATGFDAQFGTTTPPALLEHLAAIGVAPEALAPFDSSPRSDLALALAFAQGSDQAERAKAYLEVLTLNALGASWGLLSVQQGVDPAGFLQRFQAEINSIPIPQPAPTVQPTSRPPRPPVPGGRQSPSPAPTSGGQPAPVPSATASPGPENPSILPLLPEDLRRIIDELYGIVEDLLPIV